MYLLTRYSQQGIGDFILHHVFYATFVFFEALFFACVTWAAAHVIASVFRFGWGLLKRKRGTSASIRKQSRKRSEADANSIEQGLPTKQLKRPSGPPLLRRIYSFLSFEIVMLMIVEMVFFALCVLESRLLVDMNVHFIDLDLVDAMGLKQVSNLIITLPSILFFFFFLSSKLCREINIIIYSCFFSGPTEAACLRCWACRRTLEVYLFAHWDVGSCASCDATRRSVF